MNEHIRTTFEPILQVFYVKFGFKMQQQLVNQPDDGWLQVTTFDFI